MAEPTTTTEPASTTEPPPATELPQTPFGQTQTQPESQTTDTSWGTPAAPTTPTQAADTSAFGAAPTAQPVQDATTPTAEPSTPFGATTPTSEPQTPMSGSTTINPPADQTTQTEATAPSLSPLGETTDQNPTT
jgi:hypothetical protein